MPLFHGFLGFTLGQFSMGLRLISDDGSAHLKKAVFRNTFFIPIFLINYLKINNFFVYRLTWHDQVSGTRVIDLNEDDSFFNRGSCLNSVSVCVLLALFFFTLKAFNSNTSIKSSRLLAVKNKTFIFLRKKPKKIVFKPFPNNLVTQDFRSYYKEYQNAKRNALISAAVRAPANFPEPPTPLENPEEDNDGLKEYNAWRHRSRARFHIK